MIQNTYNKYSPTFKAIRTISISDKYKPIVPKIICEIENFTKSNKGFREIGEGMFSRVYQMNIIKNIVFKQTLGSDTYEVEEKALKMAPEKIKNSEKFIGRFFDDIKNEYFILTTRVSGKKANPNQVDCCWNKKRLDNFFSALFEMDKVGFYHGDLNTGNILLASKNKVNFIDYQWAKKNKKTYSKNIIAEVLFNSNSQMFEMAGLPQYIQKLGRKNSRIFLRKYLQAKSNYSKIKSYNIEKIIESLNIITTNESIDKIKKYLIAESKVLSEPSEDLIKLEILKMQFLRTYRKALKFFEEPIPNKNILPATSAYIKLLIDIKELIYEIDKQMNINSKNIEELTYLSGLKEYALFWSDKISNHLDCVFNTTLKYTNNQLTKDEMLKLNIQENIDFTSFADLPNILKLFDLEFSNAQNYELIKYDLNFLNKNFIENKAINDEIKISNTSEEMQKKADELNARLKETYANLIKKYVKS